MPGLYAKGDFDLAGFRGGRGRARRASCPRPEEMKAGDVLIGVASSRRAFQRLFAGAQGGGETPGFRWMPRPRLSRKCKTLGEALADADAALCEERAGSVRAGGVKGLAHITGGGITENLPRVLPDGLDAEIDLGAWKLSPVFAWIQREAELEQDEMLRTFNCGVGLIAVADASRADAVISGFEHAGEIAHRIGMLVTGKGEASVRYKGHLSAA